MFKRSSIHYFVTLFICLSVVSLSCYGSAPPSTFEAAKTLARQKVYYDQNQGAEPGTLYCGCDWQWLGRAGGRVMLDSCGYRVRAQETRAARLEWEHIVPAHSFGNQRRCWQNGGRENCTSSDPVFSAMEADLHNLAPAIGEVNADRSNYRFGLVSRKEAQYGACATKVDFKQRVAEPRDEVKGFVARVYFYMHDRYDLSMSDQQQRLLMAWDKQYPVKEWELERDRRIARVTGHSNPFVVGTRQWTRGHKNSAEGIVTPIPPGHPALQNSSRSVEPSAASAGAATRAEDASVIGNRNSKVYHLPEGCPGYSQVSAKNQVRFATEREAQAAGYRRAGNCR